MAPIGRYLSGNKGTETPTNVVILAVCSRKEPVPGRPNESESSLRNWHAIRFRIEKGKQTRRVEGNGETQSSWWDFLDRNSDKQRATWIFSEDLGHDLTKLQFWVRFDAGIFSIKPRASSGNDLPGSKRTTSGLRMSVDGLPTYIICRAGTRLYKFIDVRNYWRKGVFDTASPFGIPRYDPIDFLDDQTVWFARCKRNCEIVEYGVVSLISGWSSQRSGVFQLTAAALAMNNFRHTCPIRVPGSDKLDIVCKPNAREHALERLSYFGGRTTCFRVGRVNGPVYHLDVNSLFPFVMREYAYPRRFVRFQPTATHEELNAMLRCYGVVANVLIDSPIHSCPVRIDGKQYHARGNYWTVLCGSELERAMDEHTIARIGTVQVYSVSRLFTAWVNSWYEKKLEASCGTIRQHGEIAFCKTILNSLYGKWAQNGRHWIDDPDTIPIERWGGWVERDIGKNTYTKFRGIAGNSQRLQSSVEPRHSFPAISAFIAAHAREYMKELIDGMPARSVYYQAVDAIFCNQAGYDYLDRIGMIDQLAIGKFKVKDKYKTVTIYGPNHYEADGVITSSGLLGKYVSDCEVGGSVELDEQIGTIVSSEPPPYVRSRRIALPEMQSDFRGNIGKDGWWSPIAYHPLRTKALGLEAFPFPPEYFSDSQADHIPQAYEPSQLPCGLSLVVPQSA